MGYNNKNNNSRNNAKKHSGVTTGTISQGKLKGAPYIQAWNYSKRFGMRSFFCSPYGATHIAKGKTQDWENWKVTITSGHGKSTMGCLHSVTTGKVVIPELQIVINPKASNGGYCGTFYKK